MERAESAKAGRGLAAAVVADGRPELMPVVTLLVWLMRLVVEPRVTVSDGHLCGLLSLVGEFIRRLG